MRILPKIPAIPPSEGYKNISYLRKSDKNPAFVDRDRFFLYNKILYTSHNFTMEWFNVSSV